MFSKEYIRKCLAVVPSVIIAALGVVLFVKSHTGSDPLTMFEIALSEKLGWTFGTASLVFEGLLFVVFFFINRKLIGFGSFAYAFGIGPAIDMFTPIVDNIFPAEASFALNAFYIISGTILICFALAYYIPMDMGYQTSDILTLSITEWFHIRYGISHIIVYATFFTIAFFMGGPWGIGTVIAVLTYGPLIDWMMGHTAPFSRKIAGIPEPVKES
ncbi:hypothetical protein BG261_01845 [Floricoccus tropicus]|uniref:Uncharacterized protein n=2 Tax=Floricoccus tropicus TaxID=1859473 RepID=A0A1E8GM64_9LACT|nr:hypothetical protein BG261_01845 [Floricoccus tropicus]